VKELNIPGVMQKEFIGALNSVKRKKKITSDILLLTVYPQEKGKVV
jgi:hypothetical protein